MLDAAVARTPVRELMTADVARVEPGTPLHTALERMMEANVGSLVVARAACGPLRRADILGMVPVYFAIRALLSSGTGATVEAAMFTDCITIEADAPLASALPRIVDNRTWRLVVLDGEAVVGVLSATDVVRLLAGRSAGEA